MGSVSRIYGRVRQAGLYGSMKSVYYSTRLTRSPLSLVMHSKVIPVISPETDFNINNRLFIGIKPSSGSHPRIARTKFLTRPGSSVSHTGEKRAQIGPGSVVHLNGDFSMGDSFVNGFSRIVCDEAITIGDGCNISWECKMMDSDGHQIVYDEDRPSTKEPIVIQDDVWIGRSVIINKGVRVGSGSVVASGSVIVSDVPPNTLVAGNPAEVVRDDVSWEG